jgi:PEP-CTERM motif
MTTRAFILLFAALTARAGVILSDPFAGGDNADFLDRGFYVTTYPGTNLGTVTLAYYGTVAGSYTTSLTANLGAYDGPLIGTQTEVETLNDLTGSEVLVTYDFGGIAIAPGSLVTFTQAVIAGPGDAYYDVGTVFPGPDGLTETEGTTPPLDVFRRDGVGVIITQSDTVAPEPSTLLLLSAGLAGVMALSKRRP